MDNKPSNLFDKVTKIADDVEQGQKKQADDAKKIEEKINKSIEVGKSNSEDIKEIKALLKKPNMTNHLSKINNEPISKKEDKYSYIFSDKNSFIQFIKSSRKENIWFGLLDNFTRKRKIIIILYFSIIIASIISLILTSSFLKMYSTFTFLENIGFIFLMYMFSHIIRCQVRIPSYKMEDLSDMIYEFDVDGIARNTLEYKKTYKWTRYILYGGAVGNIICLWTLSSPGLAVLGTIFELILIALTIVTTYLYHDFKENYEFFVVISGNTIYNVEPIILVYDLLRNQVLTQEDFNKKYNYNI